MRFASKNSPKKPYSLKKSRATMAPGRKKLVAYGLAVLLIAVVVLVIVLIKNNAPSLDKAGTNTPANSKVDQSDSAIDTQDDKVGSQDAPADEGTSSTAPTEPPQSPYGSFVSSHSVSLSASVLSTCSTTPGASCTISFIKDGVTRSLSEKITDSDGAAYWGWTPQELGLSEGIWKIQVTAKNSTQSITVTDSLNLDVSL